MLLIASAARCGGSLITAASLEFALLEPEKTSSLRSVEKRCGNDGISPPPPRPPSPKPKHKTRDSERKRGAKSRSAILRRHLPHTMIVCGARSKITQSKLHRCLLEKHGLREGFDTFRMCMNMTACTVWCCFSEHKLQTAAKPPQLVNPLARFRV